MENKEIIIDGVDVSGCRYFCKFTIICRNESIGHVVRPSCKNVVDCYYKQLKRKEQEYERLKRDYFKQNEWLQEQKKGLDRLKQTLAEIKEIAVEIENFAERIDEDNWGILDWKIIDKSREILQKISGSEVEKC